MAKEELRTRMQKKTVVTSRTKGTNMTQPQLFSLHECLEAYTKVLNTSRTQPDEPGNISILGWNLDYINGGALATFLDQILIRRLNDFYATSPHPVILDCGANIGVSVLSYKHQYPGAKVIAFEPDPAFLPLLKRNLVRNDSEDVEVVEAAVWTENTSVSWLCEGIDGSRIRMEPCSEQATITVKTVDLADYLDQPVDLIKLDIEGAEYGVIRYLSEHDRLLNVKNLVIECHLNQSNMIDFGNMMAQLKEQGFDVSLNTFGAWRDLIRQPMLPSELHWEQYVQVSAWRAVHSEVNLRADTVPQTGAELALHMETVQAMEVTAGRVHNLDRVMANLVRHRLTGGAGLEHWVLTGPFVHEPEHGWLCSLPAFLKMPDQDAGEDSPCILFFEDTLELGPPGSMHSDIRSLGGGRFSHWRGELYFSTSDHSNPNTNGRIYSILYLNDEFNGTA